MDNKEVYVVLLESYIFDGSGGASPYNQTQDTELRGVFDSLEKAREYCENPDHYNKIIDLTMYPVESTPLSWNSTSYVYTILDHKDKDYEEDIETMHFSIEKRKVQ